MPKFSPQSLTILSTCDSRLQEICNTAIELMDFTVLCGYRDKVAQDAAFRTGKSKLEYPNSKHNLSPSLAIDITPYPINYSDYNRFILLAGLILGIAHEKNIKIRWGGDWNRDFILNNDSFIDMSHFEVE